MDLRSEAAKYGIGNTPLTRYFQDGLYGRLYFKEERYNASGSIKDRAALCMILDAVKNGVLKKGGMITEATSGNMGIALACIGKRLGYGVSLAMPDSMSAERREIIASYGARVVLTSGADGMEGAVDEARRLAAGGAVLMRQFENRANSEAHYYTTAREIYEQLRSVPDVFVAGVGTGGTLCGTAEFFRQMNPFCEIVAVEPSNSAVLSGGLKGGHAIQGIGAGFVPSLYDRSLVTRVMTVSDDEALKTFRELNDGGYSCGVSGGANFAAAMRIAKQKEYEGKTIVTVFPDGADRYMSLLKNKTPRF